MLLFLLSHACNPAPGFDAVAISPIYGWVDGCNTVTVTGRGFGDDVSAKIGDAEVTDVALPEVTEGPSNKRGYELTATVPAGSHGLHDVTVTSGGASDTITGTGGYYYVECPMAAYVESVSPTEGLTDGAVITISGCSLDAADLTAQFVTVDGTLGASGVALESGCGTAVLTFAAPPLADGTWFLQLVDGTGAVVAGGVCPPPDTADTGGSGCADYPLTFGGAR